MVTDLGWDSSANAYDAARALAKCVPVVEKIESFDADRRRAAMQFYTDQAMDMLRNAVDMGFKDTNRLAADEDLTPLRQREDFANLLTQLQSKDKE